MISIYSVSNLLPLKKKFFAHRLADSAESRAALKAMGRNVKILRCAHELSQGELAERAGCSVSVIKHIEHARNFPSLAVYLALCRSLGVNKPPLT